MGNIKKVLITGATGGVGRGIIDALHKEHIFVTVIVRPDSKRGEDLIESELLSKVSCDLSDLSSLENKLSHDYDAFFHLGWTGTYGEDRKNEEMQNKNIEITLSALRLAKSLGCTVFVGAGSQAEFGFQTEKLSPDLLCHPETAYGKAKLEAMEESKKLSKELNIRHIWCRILSAFGPGDAPYTMVMGTLLSFLKKEERKFTKGEQIWDYIYTKDLGRAFLMAAEKGKDQSIYVMGSGIGMPLKNYIEIMRDVCDPERKLVFGEIPYFENQVMFLQADISNLTLDTGFTPSYTFKEGIEETVAYLKNMME